MNMHRSSSLGLLTVCLALVLCYFPSKSDAGTFVGVLEQIGDGNVIPYAIAHPPGYSGSGGVLKVDICIHDTFLENYMLVGPLQAAIETWNSLTPTVSECTACIVWGEPLPSGALDSETSILHELGHCAMGIDHVNMVKSTPFLFASSSFTASYGATSVTDANGIPGDFDDIQNNAVDVHDISWFRRDSNNPFTIDAVVADLGTYSRSTAAYLPAGHNYAANANRLVAASLGFSNTQAIMYSRSAPLVVNRALTADDVNTVKIGMAGADLLAGPPNDADNYTFQLRYRAVCDEEAEIRVELFPLGAESGVIGGCDARVVLSYPQGGILKWHWTVTPLVGSDFLGITFNKDLVWDFGDRIYASGFENGDFSDWSAAVP